MKLTEKSVHTETQEMTLNHQMCQMWASQINSVILHQWNWFDVCRTDWSDIKLTFGSEQSHNFGFGSMFWFVLNLNNQFSIQSFEMDV